MRASNPLRQIVPVVGIAAVLTGCGSQDDCLKKVEPWSEPSETKTNLSQCWMHDDIARFYTTSIGTQMVPYRLVVPLNLAKADKADPNKPVISDEAFFTKSHIEERWRFLALEPADLGGQSDVDAKDVEAGWPVGFVVDKRTWGKHEWQGEWLGLTCAACHTGQIEYTDEKSKKWKVRIAGGSTMADFNLFLQDLKNSLTALHEDGVKGGARFAEYVGRYTERFGPTDRTELLDALKKAAAERTAWLQRNTPPILAGPAGYGRLDAFGISYNEIIEATGRQPVGTPHTNAPTSIPFLWDVSRHNQTQWNGSAPAIPLAINVAGALGIFAKYDPDAGWIEDPSTARLDKLREMQGLLDKLRSPKWPETILGPIDRTEKARAGGKLFQSKCQICHSIQEREQPLKDVKMAMVQIDENTIIRREIVLSGEYDVSGASDESRAEGGYSAEAKTHKVVTEVGLPLETDRTMAENAIYRELTDNSGNKKKAVKEALGDSAIDIIVSLSHPAETLFLVAETGLAWLRWQRGMLPEPLIAYKGRPLDGVWATAPYLHNGSVPNLYELLLPRAKRTKQFCVGSREFDPERVGLAMSIKTEKECMEKGLFWLDTGKAGNSNTGHEGPGYDMPTENQIWELVEYLKML